MMCAVLGSKIKVLKVTSINVSTITRSYHVTQRVCVAHVPWVVEVLLTSLMTICVPERESLEPRTQRNVLSLRYMTTLHQLQQILLTPRLA